MKTLHRGGLGGGVLLALVLGTMLTACAQNNPWDVRNLYANDGAFVGNTSRNTLDPNSIYNPWGRYGHPLSPESIYSPTGRYGSALRPVSPDNPRTRSGHQVPQNQPQNGPGWMAPDGGNGPMGRPPQYIRRGW